MNQNTYSLKRNYIYKLAYELLLLIMPFITTPYISRILGADGIGINSYTASYMSYFTMLAMLGTSSYGAREISRNRDDIKEYSKKFWEIETITIITSLIMLFLWIFLVINLKIYKQYFLAFTPLLIAVIFDISWLYTGLEKIKYTIIINVIFKIIGTTCLFVFVKEKNDLLIYILINTLAQTLGNLSMWIFLPKIVIKPNIKELELKCHFKETLVYFIPTIATSIYTVLDKVLIGLITNNSFENGYFEQADKIMTVCKTCVFGSINMIMGVRMSYLFFNNELNELKNKLIKSTNYILFLGYGVMFGIIAIAEDFVPLFFGPGFEKVISLIYLMAPLIIIISVSNILGAQYYIPAGLRKKSANYIIIGSIVNLVINLILIPRFASYGAAISSIVSELVITLLYILNCDNILSTNKIRQLSTKKIIAGIFMFIVVINVSKFTNGILGLLIEILLGLIVYISALLILKDSITKEILQIIMKKVGLKKW